MKNELNALLEMGYFETELNQLKDNIAKISDTSKLYLSRKSTCNYSLDMRDAYNGLLIHAVELRAVYGSVTKSNLIRKVRLRTANENVAQIQLKLISILD